MQRLPAPQVEGQEEQEGTRAREAGQAWEVHGLHQFQVEAEDKQGGSGTHVPRLQGSPAARPQLPSVAVCWLAQPGWLLPFCPTAPLPGGPPRASPLSTACRGTLVSGSVSGGPHTEIQTLKLSCCLHPGPGVGFSGITYDPVAHPMASSPSCPLLIHLSILTGVWGGEETVCEATV